MTLIGLHGHARCGKDTIADYLVENHGFTRVALADAVRDAVYALDPFIAIHSGGDSMVRVADLVDESGWNLVKSMGEGRRLLQAMGTEVGRELFGEDVWLDIATRKVNAVSGPVVVTDIRFLNELEWVNTQWFSSTAIKVKRPGFGPINEHSSDAGIPDINFKTFITNDGTLEDLYAKVDAALKL